MPQRNDGSITFEGARIIFRNFAGKEGQYNREGDRNFCVLLDEEVARTLDADGWNIKTLKPREDAEEGEPDQPYLHVTVGFKGRPPTIVMLTSIDGKITKRTNLGEEECEILDWADISNVDLMVRPYTWNVGDKTGVKAYLKSIYVTVELDELGAKYENIGIPSRSGSVEE